MDERERFNDYEEALRAAMAGHQSGVWTAMPGAVISYDATGRGSGSPTVTVQVGIKATVLASDGTSSQVNLPLLPDVPVCFPRGGGHTLTFPVAVGDECLVVFASRCIDYWWQSGGVQSAGDLRKHDINDGFAIIGPRSGAQPLGGISTTTTQLRSDAGTAFVEVNGAVGSVNILAPGGFNVTAPTMHLNGQMIATGDVTAGTVTLETHTHPDPQGGSVGLPSG